MNWIEFVSMISSFYLSWFASKQIDYEAGGIRFPTQISNLNINVGSVFSSELTYTNCDSMTSTLKWQKMKKFSAFIKYYRMKSTWLIPWFSVFIKCPLIGSVGFWLTEIIVCPISVNQFVQFATQYTPSYNGWTIYTVLDIRIYRYRPMSRYNLGNYSTRTYIISRSNRHQWHQWICFMKWKRNILLYVCNSIQW